MEHYGDITKISGYDVPCVDVITGGSPCQDLSVAGKREGLAGERSGLFMEQIRIIKEMRDGFSKELRSRGSDEYIRPRYMVWENVPGAFSSNKGEDFRTVLEETARVADKTAVIPRPPKGKWSNSGAVMGDGWSIAWRVHDAQFWGVPQRRKRIALVADFGGETAPEILFERKGVSRDIEKSGEARKRTATDAERNTSQTIGFNGWQSVKASMPTLEEKTPPIEATMPLNVVSINTKQISQNISIKISNTLGSNDYKEPQAICCLNDQGGKRMDLSEDVTGTLRAQAHGHQPIVNEVYCLQGNGIDRADTAGCNGKGWRENQSYTLNTIDRPAVSYQKTTGALMASGAQRMPDKDNFNAVIAYGLDRAAFNQGENAKYNFSVDEEKIGAQVARGPGAVYSSVVRRLTPLECERLQGYPDRWTDIGEWIDSKGKKHKDADSPRYKALGNSIALPFWQWMAKRMRSYLGKNPTMASLFDGIGGFPLVYSRCGVKPMWASEIEEFPIAVTKARIQ